MVRLAIVASLLAAVAAPAAAAQVGRPCGFRVAPCAKGLVCIPNEPSCTIWDTCGGTCQHPPPKYKSCGGFSPRPAKCAADETCIPDVRNPDRERLPDLPGICVKLPQDKCGGPGIVRPKPCSKGRYCFDDPRDSCDPKTSSIACNGICVYPKPLTPPTGGDGGDGGDHGGDGHGGGHGDCKSKHPKSDDCWDSGLH